MTANGQSGIELSTYVRGKPKDRRVGMTVTVDGESRRVSMGVQVLPVRTGSRQLAVRAGLQLRPATATVEVPEAGVVRLRWHMPTFIWQTGQLEVVEPASS